MYMTQQLQKLHFELPTQECWSHTWRKPTFQFTHCPHYDGEQFFNALPAPQGRGRADLLKWLFTRKASTWQVDSAKETAEFHATKRAIPQERPQAKLDDWQVWFIGHATVLLQIGPYNLLTDPVWCEYVAPQHGKGSKRVIPAGMALEELPTIHAVLLSHNHYDHMDLASLTWLHDKFAMPIYTGLGNSWYLPKHFQVLEMDWWQSSLLRDLKIIYTPAQHGSGRGLRDQNCALWGGFSILAGKDHCFFAGDSGYAGHFKEIQSRLGAPRVALLPIGAYEPRELMRYLHMNPAEAFQAHQDLHSKCSLAIHYRTFQLTDESREQPELDLKVAMKNTSKLMAPFYCVREGVRLVV